jgi:hypothetical protein
MNQMNEQRQELKERIRLHIHDDDALVQHNYKAIDKLSDAAVLNMWQLHKMLHAMDPLMGRSSNMGLYDMGQVPGKLTAYAGTWTAT